MVFLTKPTDETIRAILARKSTLEFFYPEVGATRGTLPAGYSVDRNRVDLGTGQATFSNACKALARWKMFDIPGLQLCWPTAPIQPGVTVGVVIRFLGLWSINTCRIVYVVDEDGPVRRYGFAYGTLPGHPIRGEERFVVEWDRSTDAVSYEMLAFSRPANLLVNLGSPLLRRLQKRTVQQYLRLWSGL